MPCARQKARTSSSPRSARSTFDNAESSSRPRRFGFHCPSRVADAGRRGGGVALLHHPVPPVSYVLQPRRTLVPWGLSVPYSVPRCAGARLDCATASRGRRVIVSSRWPARPYVNLSGVRVRAHHTPAHRRREPRPTPPRVVRAVRGVDARIRSDASSVRTRWVALPSRRWRQTRGSGWLMHAPHSPEPLSLTRARRNAMPRRRRP